MWAYDRRTQPARGHRRPRHRRGSWPTPQVALDWLFGGELGLPLEPGAGAARPPRRLLQHAGRHPLHRQLDAAGLLARHRRDRRGGARRGAQRQRLPRRPLGRHRLHRPLRRDRLQPHRQRRRRSPATPSCAAWCCSRAAAASTGGAPLTDDTLDRIEAKFDGGLFGAVRDNAAALRRRHDAVHDRDRGDRLRRPDAAEVHAADHRLLGRRRPAQPAHPRRRSRSSPSRASPIPNTGQAIISGRPGLAGQQRRRQGARPRHADALPPATVEGGIGSFLDDDGSIAQFATLRRHVGRRARPDRRRPADLARHRRRAALARRAAEQRPGADDAAGARLGSGEGGHALRPHDDRPSTPARRNFTDWYYPVAPASARPAVTGVCTARHSAPPATSARLHAATRSAARRSTSTRPRCRSAAAGATSRTSRRRRTIDIPVIAFGGSNGLAPVPGRYIAVRAEHRRVHGAELQRRAARRRRDHAEPRLPDLRRRRRRLRGATSARASPTSTSSPPRTTAQQRARAADGLPGAQRGVARGRQSTATVSQENWGSDFCSGPG